MKKLQALSSMFIAVLLLVSCENKPTETTTATETPATTGPATTYQILTDSNSLIKWKGVMLGVKEHLGTLNFKEGSVTVADGKVTGGSFAADMNTITPTDANYDEKSGYGKNKLVAHLNSADFFDVPNFPTATFVVNSVNGNEATGTLTVRGKSNEETVKNIVVTETESGVTVTGTLTFDRKKYDVAFDMPMKDMVISNDIELNIALSGVK